MRIFRGLRRPAHRRAGAVGATSKPVSLIPGLSMVNTEMAPTVRGPFRSRWLYVALSAAMVGGVGTTVAAGTWATFTASTSNSTSTFQTGTIVLTNTLKGNTASTCYSTGGVATSTDSNVNASCATLFQSDQQLPGYEATASSKRPGEYATRIVQLKNDGSLPGTLYVKSQANCAENYAVDQGDIGDQNVCDLVQLSLEDTSVPACYWGDNIGTTGVKAFLTGAPLSFPLTIPSTDNGFRITVNGVATDRAITARTYTTSTLFLAAMNDTVGTYATLPAWPGATAALSTGNGLVLTSKVTSGAITLAIPTTSIANAGLSTLGFIDGSTSSPGTCARATGDPNHTLADFRTTTSPDNGVSLGTLAAGATREILITLSTPSVIADGQQGRIAGFELTWTLSS